MRRIALLLIVFVVILLLAAPLKTSAQSSIEVQTIPGLTVAEKITKQTSESWPWYLSRGSGLLAAVALVLLMLSGIGQITGHTFRFLEPLNAWASHRALGIVFGLSILVHMFVLLFDKFIKFTLLDLLVPFYSNFKPATIAGVPLRSFYLALGILSLYLSSIIIVISLLWINKRKHLWKITHILSYLVMGFIFFHALLLGTDLAGGLLRWLWILLGSIVLFGTIARIRRAYTAK